MDFDFFNFLALPREIQLEILLHEDLPTLYHLCRTNKAVRHLCYNERLWKDKYLETLNDIQTENTDPSDIQLLRTYLAHELSSNANRSASFWMKKLKLVRLFQDPRKLFTFKSRVSFSNQNANQPPTIIGNYNTEYRNFANQCIVDEYNFREEPVYSLFNDVMTKVLEANTYAHQPSIFGNVIESFSDILKRGKFSVQDIFDITTSADNFGILYELEINNFFDLRDDFEDDRSFTLFVNGQYFNGALLTVAASNVDEFYNLLASILNNRFMYYEKYEPRSAEKNSVQRRIIAPTLNFIVNQLLETIDKEEKAGLLQVPAFYDGETVREIIEKSSLVTTRTQIGGVLSNFVYGHYHIVQGRLKTCPRVEPRRVQPRQFSSLVPSHIPLPPPLNMPNSNLPTLQPISPPISRPRSPTVSRREPSLRPGVRLPSPPEDWIRMLQERQQRR